MEVGALAPIAAQPPPGPFHVVITRQDGRTYSPANANTLPPAIPGFAWGDTCKDSKDKVTVITASNAAGVEPWFVKCMRILYPGYDGTCSGYNDTNKETKAEADARGGGDNYIKIEHIINRLASPFLAGSRLPEGITHAFRDSGPDAKNFTAATQITYVYNPSDYTDPATRSAVTNTEVIFPQVGEIIEIKAELFDKIFRPGIINWFKARINVDLSCDIRFMLTIEGRPKVYGTHIVGTRSDTQGRPNPSKKNTWPAFTPYPPSQFPFPGDVADTLIDGSKCFIGNGEKNAYFNSVAYNALSDETIHMLCAILIGKEVFGDTAIGLFAYLSGYRNAAVFTSDYMLTAECLAWHVNSVTTSFDRIKGTSSSKATIFVPTHPELLPAEMGTEEERAAAILAAKVAAEVSSKLQTINDIITYNNKYLTLLNNAISTGRTIKESSGNQYGNFDDAAKEKVRNVVTCISIINNKLSTIDLETNTLSIPEFQKIYNYYKIVPIIKRVDGNGDVFFNASTPNPFRHVDIIQETETIFSRNIWPGFIPGRSSPSTTFLSYIRSTLETVPLLRTVPRTDIIAQGKTMVEALKKENDEDDKDRSIHPAETSRSREMRGGVARLNPRSQVLEKIKYVTLQEEDKYDIEIISELDPSNTLKILIDMFAKTIYIDDIYDILYYLFDIEGETCFKPTIIRELIKYVINDNTDMFDKYRSLINSYPFIIDIKRKPVNARLLQRTTRGNNKSLAKRFLYEQLPMSLVERKQLEKLLDRNQPWRFGGQRKTKRSKRHGKKQTRRTF